MTFRPTAPLDPALAQRYRQAGFWRAEPVRAGIERVASAEPGRPAVIDHTGSWTYGELRAQVEHCIGSLVAAGVRPGDPVVIVAPISRSAVAAVGAVIRSGGLAIVLDRRCGPVDLANAIESSGARHVVIPAELRLGLRLADHDVIAMDLGALGRGARVDDWEEPDRAAPRVVIFTSGTTRRPKGVVHSLDSIYRSVDNLILTLGLTSEDCMFLSSPIGTPTGLVQILSTLEGGRLVLDDQFSAPRALAAIEEHGVTAIGGAPVILELLFDEYERQRWTRSSLRRVALGGTMIPRSVLEVAIERFGIIPSRVYGSSEVPMHTASHPDDALEARLGDDGVLMPGSEVRLGDEHDSGAELLVRGPNRFLGYLHSEDNDGAFEDGWFRTGDLVEIDPGPRVRVSGRLKDVVARKGIKISLAEVDDAARSMDGVIEAAAYGVADDVTGERVVLALRAPDAAQISYEAVIEAMERYGLAKGKLPEEIVVWDEPLPRNSNGKIVRAQLAAGAVGRPVHQAPRLRGAATPAV